MPSNGSLIRITESGTESTIDDYFDHIVNETGLLELLRGADEISSASWTPTKASILRQKQTASGGEVLPDMDVIGEDVGRLVISGPAKGCPFLADSLKLEPYKNLGLDPTRVQTRGCTFCLDNIGAYAHQSEEKTVAVWLEQIRLRQETIGKAERLEVLLTDERPHPYLPAFFSAVEEAGDIGPIELLFKSRIDWFTEFADTAIQEACDIAERSNSVLHLYLVGFENFDPYHLELFNKGHRVEDNITAIDKIRDLKSRSPKSFEYERLKAHGIILFTPWTEPEALLRNAVLMRQVKFSEFRTEAIRTRLRLYERTPLYHLAKHDGLLADSHSVNRPDRSMEQGYDASIPWKFKDCRTEAIFVCASNLAKDYRSLNEADVLELSTRFVLKWPTVELRDISVLFRYTLNSWGGPLESIIEGLGTASILDSEVDELLSGTKRASLKELVRTEDADSLKRAYQAGGLYCEKISFHSKDELTGDHRAGSDYCILAIAGTKSDLDDVVDSQQRMERREPGVINTLGELMGYPQCCVTAFAEQENRRDNHLNETAMFLRAPDAALDALNNRFVAPNLLSHHLCSPNCPSSKDIAQRRLERIAEESSRAASWVLSRLSSAILFIDYERRWLLEGEYCESSYVVHSLESVGGRRGNNTIREGLQRVSIESGRVILEYSEREEWFEGDAFLIIEPGNALHEMMHSFTGARKRLPALPGALRKGRGIRGYKITDIRNQKRRYVLTLTGYGEKIDLLIAKRDDAASKSIICGEWVLNIEADCAFSKKALKAIETIAMVLGWVRSGETA